ncbi:hypothetical protein A8H39_01630 [Paraburkholderia fungorum]|uniref:hypothetical protein n=1 Tax=Paraburkholderia fungorum TaxID=134537 RepID=UPI000486BF00|nr:hypothetical protein [Paraburkholderia fungorum]PNE59872.1 hypothetical protein A8H39_01630 [Paraburkholderia fungorum]
MKKLVLYHCRLRRAPLLVRVIVAAAALLVAALVKEALRPVWAHFYLAPSMMDFVVTMLEFPVVAFFASPAVRGLPASPEAPAKRVPLETDFAAHNPFSMRLTDDLRADSAIGEPWVDTRVGDDLNR